MKLYDLAKMTTTTTGTGTISLAAAVSGFLTFDLAGVQDGDIVRYGIRDGAHSEIGWGVYTTSGATLTRNPIKSTNSDAAINLSGSAQVFICASSLDVGNGKFLLAEFTASSVASLTINNWYSSRFDLYEIDLINVAPTTDNVNLSGHLSTDNGATFDAGANYNSVNSWVFAGSPGANAVDAGTQVELGGLRSNAANFGGYSSLKLVDPGGSKYKTILSNGVYHATGASLNTMMSANHSIWKNISAYNALRIQMSSGNFSCVARVYGMGK